MKSFFNIAFDTDNNVLFSEMINVPERTPFFSKKFSVDDDNSMLSNLSLPVFARIAAAALPWNAEEYRYN